MKITRVRIDLYDSPHQDGAIGRVRFMVNNSRLVEDVLLRIKPPDWRYFLDWTFSVSAHDLPELREPEIRRLVEAVIVSRLMGLPDPR
jgi:hypothetical protein